MSKKLWYRRTLRYKVKMWFYHLTFADISKWIKVAFNFIFEIIMLLIGLFILFILPAFFH